MKKQFKIIRFGKSCLLSDKVVEIASRSNGLDVPVTIDEIENFCKCEILRLGYVNYVVTSRINDFTLVIDNDREPALEIREVEEHSIVGEVPTLERQQNN